MDSRDDRAGSSKHRESHGLDGLSRTVDTGTQNQDVSFMPALGRRRQLEQLLSSLVRPVLTSPHTCSCMSVHLWGAELTWSHD